MSKQIETWGNNTILNLSKPETLQPNQLIRVNQTHLRQYVENTSGDSKILFLDSKLLEDNKNFEVAILEELRKYSHPSITNVKKDDNVVTRIVDYITQYNPMTFVFETGEIDGLDEFTYKYLVDQVMVHFDRKDTLTMFNVIIGVESEHQHLKELDNQILRVKDNEFENFMSTQEISRNIKIIDGTKLKTYDDFLMHTYQLFEMPYITSRNANGLIDWLTDSYYIGSEQRDIIFGIKNFSSMPIDLQKNIQLTIDGYAGVLQYWDDEVIAVGDQKYRRFTFVIGV